MLTDRTPAFYPPRRRRRKGISVCRGAALLLLFLFLLATGCGTPQGVQTSSETAGPFPLTLKDDLGRVVRLENKPQRIVSLAPGNTEILFALGLADRIVAVSEYCDYPAEALQKPTAGTFAEPVIEQIVALEPHLAVAVQLQEEVLARLEDMGIPVLVLSPITVEEIYKAIGLLGRAAGVEENARLLVGQMQSRIQIVDEELGRLPTVEKIRVYYEVYADPLMSAGHTSLIHDLIQTAGGINIFADLDIPHPKISAEAVIDRNPEIIIFPFQHGSEGFLGDEIGNRPGWQSIAAVKQGRVVGVEPDMISRPGPRVVEAVEELAALFYPDLIKE